MQSIGNQDLNKSLPYSYLRILNAVPDSKPLDIYINGKLVASGLSYQQFTEYFKALAGTYTMEVYYANTKGNPLAIMRFSISSNTIYTAALTGTMDNMTLELISDKEHTKDPNFANMRFTNLSPDIGGVTVYVDKVPVIYDLSYGEVSNFLRLPPGKHTITIVATDTNNTVATHPGVYLRGGNYYATHVVGLNDTNPPEIEILIPLEGSSYLKFE